MASILTFHNNNILLSTSTPGDPSGTYSNTYNYNAHGSMITMPHISQLAWNHAEQLQSTDLGGGGIVYYCYDAGGNRSRKMYEHSGITEDRIYLGEYEIYRKTRANTVELERETLHVSDDTKRIVLFETKTVDVDNPAGLPQVRVRWQLDNHLGSSSTELDNSAQVISYEEYHPFGSTSFHTVDTGVEVSAKQYRYTGKERDDETGLYYYGARYYASWLGRWTGCDPSLKDGLNLYTYVRNNPVALIDPNGQDSSSPILQKWNSVVADARNFKSMISSGIENLENNMISYARESAEKQHRAGLISNDQVESGMLSAAAFTAIVGVTLTLASEMTVNAGANFIEFLENTSTALGEGTARIATGDVKGGIRQLGNVTGLVTAGENIGEGIYDLTQGNYAVGATKISGGMATAAGNVIMFSQLGNKLVPEKSAPVRDRLPQDINVNPNAPRSLPTNRPIGQSVTQNAAAQAQIKKLQLQGYTDIRVDQQQINSAGQRVGVNRPDIQATSPSGQRTYLEYDLSRSQRGVLHQARILANDPSGKVILRTVD